MHFIVSLMPDISSHFFLYQEALLNIPRKNGYFDTVYHFYNVSRMAEEPAMRQL